MSNGAQIVDFLKCYRFWTALISTILNRFSKLDMFWKGESLNCSNLLVTFPVLSVKRVCRYQTSNKKLKISENPGSAICATPITPISRRKPPLDLQMSLKHGGGGVSGSRVQNLQKSFKNCLRNPYKCKQISDFSAPAARSYPPPPPQYTAPQAKILRIVLL